MSRRLRSVTAPFVVARPKGDSTRPEDREERAANSAVHGVATPIREPVNHKAREQPHPRRKTRPAERNCRGPGQQRPFVPPGSNDALFVTFLRNGDG